MLHPCERCTLGWCLRVDPNAFCPLSFPVPLCFLVRFLHWFCWSGSCLGFNLHVCMNFSFCVLNWFFNFASYCDLCFLPVFSQFLCMWLAYKFRWGWFVVPLLVISLLLSLSLGFGRILNWCFNLSFVLQHTVFAYDFFIFVYATDIQGLLRLFFLACVGRQRRQPILLSLNLNLGRILNWCFNFGL